MGQQCNHQIHVSFVLYVHYKEADLVILHAIRA